MTYIRKYRPQTIAGIAGQTKAVRFIDATVASMAETGEPVAFVLSGPSGTGKTTAGWAIARQLGCDVDNAELGGVVEIASGQQDGAAVKDMAGTMRLRPMTGSGWRVVIVNEADAMTKGAELVWLDVLENLPSKCCVVFSTNSIENLSGRFLSRCHVVKFEGAGDEAEKSVVRLVKEVLAAEGVEAPADLTGFGRQAGAINYRLALQQAFRFACTGELPEAPQAPAVSKVRPASADGLTPAQKAWATRKARAAAAAAG